MAQNKVLPMFYFYARGKYQLKGDDKGQSMATHQNMFFKNLHTDFVIVGRGIYKTENVEKSCKTLQLESWNALPKIALNGWKKQTYNSIQPKKN